MSRHVISDPDEAARRGMHGSPAILLDGLDPLAGPGLQASVTCRLYRDGHGRADGAPSVRQLRHAVRHRVTIVADSDSRSWLDALGRGGKRQLAPAERGLRAVHQAVRRSFTSAGRPPGSDVLDEAARPSGTSTGGILSQSLALEVGQQIFGPLLHQVIRNPARPMVAGGQPEDGSWRGCARWP